MSVIVPTYNEADNVECLVQHLTEVLTGLEWEVIFVDDDSPDGTVRTVRRIGKENARVRCVHRIGRRGLSTACIEGMLASSAPYLAVMDCDLQHDPPALRKMIDILLHSDAELVVASRYVAGSKNVNVSTTRGRVSLFGARLGRWIVAQELKDPMSNFFALDRLLFDEVAPGLSGLSFKLLLDMLLTVRRPVSWREIPFALGTRTVGVSKFNFVVVWEYLLLLADKFVGRYIPLRFLSPALIGTFGAAVHLGVVSVSYGIVGLGFLISEVSGATLSILFSYFANSRVTYRNSRLRWENWLGTMSFVFVCAIGAMVNVLLANTLFQRGTAWSVSAVAGVVSWVVWNCAVSNYSLGRRS